MGLWPAEGYCNWQPALFWESGSGSSVDWSCTCWSESSAPLAQLGHKISQGGLQRDFGHFSQKPRVIFSLSCELKQLRWVWRGNFGVGKVGLFRRRPFTIPSRIASQTNSQPLPFPSPRASRKTVAPQIHASIIDVFSPVILKLEISIWKNAFKECFRGRRLYGVSCLSRMPVDLNGRRSSWH